MDAFACIRENRETATAPPNKDATYHRVLFSQERKPGGISSYRLIVLRRIKTCQWDQIFFRKVRNIVRAKNRQNSRTVCNVQMFQNVLGHAGFVSFSRPPPKWPVLCRVGR